MAEVWALALISAGEVIAWDLYGGGEPGEALLGAAIVFGVLLAFGKALAVLTDRRGRR